jgi:hypothetical protein
MPQRCAAVLISVVTPRHAGETLVMVPPRGFVIGGGQHLTMTLHGSVS